MVKRDFGRVRNKLAKAAQAILEVRGSLVTTGPEGQGHDEIIRDIDQFTAREACTVLAALRVLQVIQGHDGRVPAEIGEVLSGCSSGTMTRLAEMDHFETEAPLNVTELDYLCERIAVDFGR
jgi:hypothetical protein